MKARQHDILCWLMFLLEMYTLYLFMLPFSIYAQSLPPAIPIVTMTLSAALLYGVILYKTKSVKPALALIPLVVLIGTGVGYHVYVSVLLALIMFWRVLSNLEDRREETHELKVFAIAFIAGLILYFWSYYIFDDSWLILVLIFVHFLFTLGIRAFSIITSSQTDEASKRRNFKWMIGTLLLASTAAFLGGSVYPYFKQSFHFVMYYLTLGLSYLAIPLLNFLALLVGNTQEQEETTPGYYVGEVYNFVHQERNDVLDFRLIFWTVAIGLLCALLFFLYKKFIHSTFIGHAASDSTTDNLLAMPAEKKPANPFSIRSRLTPENEVRRLFYKTEAIFAKKECGRKEFQTVEDWITSLSMDSSAKQTIIETYHRARYGDKVINKQELTDYRTAIKKLWK